MPSFRFVALALGLATLCASAAIAQVDITAPGNPLVGVAATPGSPTSTLATVGTVAGANNYPAAEAPPNAIDNVTSAGNKYLNFAETNVGLIVTPSGSGIVTSLRLSTANDAPERDPVLIVLEGTNDPNATTTLNSAWTQIYSGPCGLTVNPGRNTNGADVSFPNAAAYTSYRLLITSVRDGATANSMQFSEVELLAGPDRSVAYATTGTGTGSVEFQPGGAVCTSACVQSFVSGTEVTVTPTADPGSYFVAWFSGPCAGATGPCTFTLGATDVTIVANFQLNPSVIYTTSGTGTGSSMFEPGGAVCTSACAQPFSPGTEVTITPTADSGSFFAGWFLGPCAGATGPCTFTIGTSDVLVAASFPLNPRVIYAPSGTGTGSAEFQPGGTVCTIACGPTFPPGTEVTVTPTADPGSFFAGWFLGPCAGATGPCTFTIGTSDVLVAASFQLNPRVIYATSGSGTGSSVFEPGGAVCTSACAQPFSPGTEVTITPTADLGSLFVQWALGPCAGLPGPCTFVIDTTDVLVAAGFQLSTPPEAVCRDVTIDATASCPSFFITPADVDNGSTDPDIAMGDFITLALDNSGPFPIGQTVVTLTVTDSAGLSDTCTATVTVLAEDCNANSIPDTCDIESGSSLDCNQNLIPDECECFWDNGKLWVDGNGPIQGQASHIGGAIPFGAKAAEDFYLEPGWVHKIDSFTGTLSTNSGHGLRRARIEFYNDCNGTPDTTAFRTFLDFEIISELDLADGFTLVTYRFNLCDLDLWLDGGKSYWVSLIGLSDNLSEDISFWVATTGGTRPGGLGIPPLIAKVPVKADGLEPPHPGRFDPWMPIDECCIGCRNLEFVLTGQVCRLLWDNGPVDLSPITRGGSHSGASGIHSVRSADNFVIKTCRDEQVCMIDGYIWTNCNPIHAFIELYANECALPDDEALPAFTGVPDEIEPIEGEYITVAGQRLYLYHLKFTSLEWTLTAGTNYWISLGAFGDNSANGRALFAYSTRCGESCDIRLTPAVTRALTPTLEDWLPLDPPRDLAFRIATHPETRRIPEISHENPCPADVNSSGDLTVQDLFDFLAAWFTGCP